MKQRKPFSAIITSKDKADLEYLALDGQQRGIFFSTSGKALTEVVRTSAQYEYIFRTNNGKPQSW